MAHTTPPIKTEKVYESTLTIRRRKGPQADSEEVEEKVLKVHRFVTEPAKVAVEYGLTLNLGDFESARIVVGVTLPCYVEEVDAVFQGARKFCQERVQHEVGEIRKGVQKKQFKTSKPADSDPAF